VIVHVLLPLHARRAPQVVESLVHEMAVPTHAPAPLQWSP
jgi:hypothetical protein